MNAEEAAKAIQEQVLQAEPARARALATLAEVRRRRAGALERERRRLGALHGDEDRRVLATTRRLESDRGLATFAELESERARTEVPRVGEGQWALHGRVLRRDLTGVAAVTISLHDESGAWIEHLGRACSDARGYFLFKPRRRVEEDDRTLPEVWLRAYDREGTLLHTADRSRTLRAGAADYVELVLGEPPAECPPPPAAPPSKRRRGASPKR